MAILDLGTHLQPGRAGLGSWVTVLWHFPLCPGVKHGQDLLNAVVGFWSKFLPVGPREHPHPAPLRCHRFWRQPGWRAQCAACTWPRTWPYTPALLLSQSHIAQCVGEERCARGVQPGPECGGLVHQEQEPPPAPKAAPGSATAERRGALSSSKPAQSPTGSCLEGRAGWGGALCRSGTRTEGRVRNHGHHRWWQERKSYKVCNAGRWGWLSERPWGLWPGSASTGTTRATAPATPMPAGVGKGAARDQGRGVQGGSCVFLILVFF